MWWNGQKRVVLSESERTLFLRAAESLYVSVVPNQILDGYDADEFDRFTQTQQVVALALVTKTVLEESENYVHLPGANSVLSWCYDTVRAAFMSLYIDIDVEINNEPFNDGDKYYFRRAACEALAVAPGYNGTAHVSTDIERWRTVVNKLRDIYLPPVETKFVRTLYFKAAQPNDTVEACNAAKAYLVSVFPAGFEARWFSPTKA